MVLLIPFILDGSDMLLRPFKSILIALLYHLNADDSCLDTFSEED